jgi:Mn2+/Fe2+ NRAMP family transporter
MKGVLSLALGVMTAIGGFVDIGNLVTSGITGARFGMTLAWAVLLGTAGMVLFGEMAGRVVAVAQRPVFHLVRERLGARVSLVNAAASTLLNVVTLAAEIGGISLVLQMVTGVSYLIWVPLAGLGGWLTVWRMPYHMMERIFGLLGLGLIVFVVALFRLPTDWSALWHQVSDPGVPAGQPAPTWWFYAISLIGACVVPYQVIFFSSGGREENWTIKSMGEMRLNAFIGFPLGALLSLAIMAAAVPVLQPRNIQVGHLDQVALPVASALGKAGLVFVFISFFAATFAASAESALSTGYSVAQYFGWSWGKKKQPNQTARFHLVCLASMIAATAFILTTIDPVTVTIVSVALGAAAVPLTYFPLLIVANDARYMGRWVNRRWVNAAGTLFLLIMVVVSVATLPLMFLTKAGQ